MVDGASSLFCSSQSDVLCMAWSAFSKSRIGIVRDEYVSLLYVVLVGYGCFNGFEGAFLMA